MNKIIFVIAVVITVFFINLGLILRSHMMDTKKQKNVIVSENLTLSEEVDQKQRFKKNVPKTISKAFTLFVNEIKMFETYSGTRMNIALTGSKENENIEDHYVDTKFRNVKGLSLTINVEKFSNETDMAEVLNDIYLLENRTDFKVSEISTENNVLIVKGELYGI
jgi:hypothetical protein